MPGRRTNGEGSVYLRKDGRWEAAAWVYTVSGIHKRVRVYADNRTEAHAKLVTLRAQANAGYRHPDAAWRLGEYLDYWLREVVKPNRREATWELYEMAVRRHIKPFLGTKYLTKLSVQQVQVFVNARTAAGASARTTHLLRTVLSSALARAQKEELVTRNVARLIELPHWESKDVTPWSVNQARCFLAIAQTQHYYGPFFMLIHYGMRRGEVLGLRWCDVDFENGTIFVRQQLQRHNSGLHFGPVKTAAGKRLLPLLPAARALLTDLWERPGRASPLPGQLLSDELVFTSSVGGPIEPNNLVRTFHAVRQQAGLPRINLHYLRHTTATMLKDLGVPARDAQLILGHAHISTTQQLYQHSDITVQRRALGRIETALAQPTPRATAEP